MSAEEIGAYMKDFIRAYKTGSIPKHREQESLFRELKRSVGSYEAVCERNKNNRLKSKPCKNDSSTSRRPVVDHSVNQEPRTNNQEPEAASFDIIKAFDDALCTAWGENFRRLCPTQRDRLTAAEWSGRGITPAFCKKYLTDEMRGIKAKGKPPPTALSFFNSSIATAFAGYKKQQDDDDDDFTPEEIARARLITLQKTGMWDPQWGPKPEAKHA